jgi:serine/threonine protein kinase
MNEHLSVPPKPELPAADAAGLPPGHETVDEVAASTSEPALPAPVEVPAALAQHPRYRVLKLLGKGGMGAVYLAEHKVMERAVALKVIRPDLTARPELVERFRREARAAARLSHPHVVTAYDAEQAGDCHFLVTEYVAGIDLARWLQAHGPLPATEACGYVRQAALGLQHAHEHRMVHRDLKPHNLMRTPAGQVKILDFGLARLAQAGAEGGTASGAVLGTADYMAPEQANDARSADIRADIYSLGCTLYELLSDTPPFPGGGLLDKLRRHALEQPTPLTHFRPELPAELVAVVVQMLAKDPAGRYQTPADVAAALEPWCRAPSDVAGQPGPPTPGRRSSRRWAAALAGAVAVVLLVGVALAFFAQERGRGPLGKQDAPSSGAMKPEQPGRALERSNATPPSGAPLTGRPSDLHQVRPEMDLDFSNAKESRFDHYHDESASDARIENGRYVMRLATGPGVDDKWGRMRWFSQRPRGEMVSRNLACQVVGRVLTRRDNGWALVLHTEPRDPSIAVRLCRDGSVEVGNCFEPHHTLASILAGPFEHAARPSGEFNTLLVLLRGGRTVEVYVNGSVVCQPIRLKEPLGPVFQDLMLWKRGRGEDDPELCAEFTRFTVWELPEPGYGGVE